MLTRLLYSHHHLKRHCFVILMSCHAFSRKVLLWREEKVDTCLRIPKQMRQTNFLLMILKKSPSDEFFVRKFGILPVFFNYLLDSNSIFRARGINSKWVPDCTVSQWTETCITAGFLLATCSSPCLICAEHTVR